MEIIAFMLLCFNLGGLLFLARHDPALVEGTRD